MKSISVHRLVRLAVLVLLSATVIFGAAACGAKSTLLPEGTQEPDVFLYERGATALEERKWLRAREYFRHLVDTYPQSPRRPDAKLGLGDAYLGEGSTESLILAINEFREFLMFFPTHRRADYAQYKLGMAHHRQMLAPDRDQSETRAAIKEFEAFVDRFPNSSLRPEVEEKLREARDRLSASEYRVGLFYFRAQWWPGAIDRFQKVLKSDPGYTNRDAVYFHLAESLVRIDRKAEALPYYQRLLDEFVESEYLDRARLRLTEIGPLNATIR
jgi:outer membrane protein assembly factor BamD